MCKHLGQSIPKAALCSIHLDNVNGLRALHGITLEGQGGMAFLFMIESQTAHLTHKPYSESTESHS
jgi:hypothetical protein